MYRSTLLLLGSLLLSNIVFSQCEILSTANSICSFEELTLLVENPSSSSTYSWDIGGDGTQIIEEDTANITFDGLLTDSTFTIVLLQDGNPCNSIEIEVYGSPVIDLGVPLTGNINLTGNLLKSCQPHHGVSVEIFNFSPINNPTSGYQVDWGDGIIENYSPDDFSPFAAIAHLYTEEGYYTIGITAISNTNSCNTYKEYIFYMGVNPAIGFATPGNTVGLCAPATIDFPILNYEDNPSGTEYLIFVNGDEVAYYDQDNIPEIYSHTFFDSSCGLTTSTGNYENAYDVQIIASNPCNSSTATIEPIEISEGPSPEILFDTTLTCTEQVITFINNTAALEVIGGSPSTCVTELTASWSIDSPSGAPYEIISGSPFGSNELQVSFPEAGTYYIEMIINSPACGLFAVSDTLVIEEPPTSYFEIEDLSGSAGTTENPCAPFAVFLDNSSLGDSLIYQWDINTDGEFSLGDGYSENSEDLELIIDNGGVVNIGLSAENTCASVSWDTTFTVAGPPSVDLQPLQDGCLGLELDLNGMVNYQENGNEITSFQWTFQGHPTGSSADSIPELLLYNQPGQYFVEIFIENACGSNSSIDSFFIQEPTNLELAPDTSICLNSGFINLSANPVGGIWTGTGTDSQGNFNPAAAGEGNFILTYAYGVGDCNTNQSMNVEVLGIPELDTDNISVCESVDSISLEASPAGGSWTPLSTVILNEDVFYPSQFGSGSYQFEYTLAAVNGCSNSIISQVNVNALPSPSVDDIVYCLGNEALPLPQPQPAGGTFTGPGLVNGTSFSAADAGGIGSYTLDYTYEDANMCIGSTTFTVEVIDAGQIEAGEDLTVCIDQGIVQLEGFNPLNGQWSGNGIITNDGQFNPQLAGPGIHDLSYRIGSGSCELIDQISITVIDLTAVDAGALQESCQYDDPYLLTGASPIGGSWSGPGLLDIDTGLFDPELAGPGTHVMVYTISEEACFASSEKIVKVYANPEANFTPASPPCVNTNINFSNSSVNAVSYSWKFGNQLFSSETNPSTTYLSEGSYDVSLITTSDFGCKDTLTSSIDIVSAPSVAFELATQEGCDNFILEPDNLSAGFDVTYLWDFGNGQTSTQAIPDFDVIYPADIYEDSTYIISLTVDNICGSETVVDSVLIHPYPIADFGILIDTVCDPYQVQFENVSYGSPVSFDWDFGNDSLSTEEFPGEQLYDADTIPIDYDITLIVENTCGLDTLTQTLTVNPVIVNSFFNTSSAEGCPPFEVNFEDFSTPGVFISWDFGDGNLSTETDPTHVFDTAGIYLVRQFINNGCAFDTSEIQIQVFESPEVSFEFEGPFCSNLPVEFLNNSVDLAGSQWYFGDIDSSTLVNPSFLFQTPGDYTVTLIGTKNETGCRSTFTQDLTIHDFPEASFAFDGFEGCIPLQVNFENSSVGSTYYYWDFGDGNNSIAANPAHSFNTAGSFTPSLTSTDQNSCSDTTVFDLITVHPLPQSDFSFEVIDTCGLPAEVQFSEEANEADAYEWNFNDTDLTNLNNPAYVFQNPGIQEISLISITQFNCRDTITKTLELFEQPFADFELDALSDCQPVSFQPMALATNTDSYQWMIGDSIYNTGGLNPVITLEEAGIYDLSLIAGNMDRCYDTLTYEEHIEVLEQPLANFVWVENPDGQPEQSIQFISLSQYADQHFWDLGDGTLTTEINPIHRYFEGQPVDIRLEVLNNNGCKHDTLLNIIPPLFGSLYVPNAFTPDYGNQEATLFMPKGIGLSEYRLQIFSTYGQLIWETTLLKDGSPAEGWDGRFNGRDLPQDTYVWKVYAVFQDGREWVGTETKDGKILKMGSVLLLR